MSERIDAEQRSATRAWTDASDESLVEAIAAGKEDALDELIRRYRRGIFSVVARILSCHADVEEVVQDVFVLVWKHAARFRSEAKVVTWILTIARNTAVSRLRRANRVPTPIGGPVRDPDLVSERPDPEQQAAGVEAARQMWSRIAKLPVLHRAVIVGIVRHSSSKTVASHQGVVTGTIKSRLHRARAALRDTIENNTVRWSDGPGNVNAPLAHA
jgi:RNA polymerase sigma-70 factor, ECF subfamily